LRILVVDDDELSREVLAVLLEGAGYAVEMAESGDDAVAKIADGDLSRPDVVLTDMQMPGTTGTALALALRSVCGEGVKLLAMSGTEPEGAALSGFDGFLLKPFPIEDVALALMGAAETPKAEETQDGTGLNEATFQMLRKAMPSDQLAELYALCVSDAKKRIARMRKLSEAGDDAEFRRQGHALKGGCGVVGAVEMQAMALRMEKNGLTAANHVASLDEFLLACDRLERILNAHDVTLSSGAPGANRQISGESTQ